MNVKVKIELSSSPEKKDQEEMYAAAESLTNIIDSIYIYQPPGKTNELVAEFSIDKARQIDVVDRIGNKFRINVENYSQSTISFSDKSTRRITDKAKSKYTPKQG